MSEEELVAWSALRLAEAIRTRQVSSTQVVSAHLDRIESVHDRLNAVVHLARDSALDMASRADEALARGEDVGPFHGVPFTVKDLIEVSGMPCTSGTEGRRHVVPDQDATLVCRLKAAGAIVLGKTNTPEIGFAVETDNDVHGRTNNPYDFERTPGGSSGGEAAIIAAYGSPLGLGSDSGGSIRLPAHFCGVAGLCPTSGRAPRTGTFPPHLGLGQERAQLGPLARNVSDLVAALPILSGPDWRDPSVRPMPLGDPDTVPLKDLRISFHTDNGIYSPDPDTITAVERAALSLTDAVDRVEHARPAGIEETSELVFGLSAEGLVDFQASLQAMGTSTMSSLVADSIGAARAHAPPLSLGDINRFITRLNRFRATMIAFMADYDVILCPVAGFPARPHGGLRQADTVLGISYTQTYNLTGWPAATLRVATAPGGPTGLPVGVQIIGAPAREDIVLRVALELENRLGGFVAPRL